MNVHRTALDCVALFITPDNELGANRGLTDTIKDKIKQQNHCFLLSIIPAYVVLLK